MFVPLFLAATVGEQLEKYGAYFGIASFIALAVLTLLYFAQAREIKRLRDWAASAHEHAQGMERRLAAQQTATQRIAAEQQQATATLAALPKTGGFAPARAATAAPPSGNGTPLPDGDQVTDENAEVLADGTRPAVDVPSTNGSTPDEVVAEPEAASEEQPAEAEDAAESSDAAAAEPAAVAAVPAGQETVDAPELRQESEDVPSVRPLTPAGGAASGVGAPGSPPPRPTAPPPSRPAAPLRATGATSATRATRPPARPPGGPVQPVMVDEPRRRRVPLIVGALAALLAGLVLLFVVLSGGDDGGGTGAETVATPTPEATSTPDSGGNGGGSGGASRGETTVAVLNGTTIAGLAKLKADEIEKAGFKPGATANAEDQARAKTAVLYEDGYRERAVEVAKIMKLGEDAVAELDADTKAIADANAEPANIVVIVGADQSQ